VEGFAILLPVRGRLARNDVVNVTHGKAFDLNPPPPGVFEMFYPQERTRGQFEWPFLLHKILASLDIRRLLVRRANPTHRHPPSFPVGGERSTKQVGVLCGVRKPRSIAPDFPINSSGLGFARKASRISSAWRIQTRPYPSQSASFASHHSGVLHRIERAERSIVQHRFVSVNKRVANRVLVDRRAAASIPPTILADGL